MAKIMFVISKNKDALRPIYPDRPSQCVLMQDIKAAGIKLVLGHMDMHPVYSMVVDAPFWRGNVTDPCYDDPYPNVLDANGNLVKAFEIREVDVSSVTNPDEFE